MAIEEAGYSGKKVFIEPLKARLDSPQERIKHRAIMALCRIRDESVI